MCVRGTRAPKTAGTMQLLHTSPRCQRLQTRGVVEAGLPLFTDRPHRQGVAARLGLG